MSDFDVGDVVEAVIEGSRWNGNTCTVIEVQVSDSTRYKCIDHELDIYVILVDEQMKLVPICPDCGDINCVNDDYRDDSGEHEYDGKECKTCGHVWDIKRVRSKAVIDAINNAKS